MFKKFAGGSMFCKTDLSQANLQLQLAEESRSYTTINTPRGLYHFKRMPFGVASGTPIFQRTFENILRGLPKMAVQVDEKVVMGTGDANHLFNVEQL